MKILSFLMTIVVMLTVYSQNTFATGFCNVMETVENVLVTPKKSIKNTYNHYMTRKKVEKFDFNTYEEYRNYFKLNPTMRPSGKTIEENIAFLDEFLQKQDESILTVKEILESEDWTKKRKVLELFDSGFIRKKHFRFDSNLSGKQIDEFFKNYYLTIDNRNLSLATVLFDSDNIKIQKSFNSYVDEKISSEGLKSIFAGSNSLASNKTNVLTNIKKILNTPEAQNTMGVLFNMHLLKGQIEYGVGYLPKTQWVRLPNELIEKGVLYGSESVKDELFALVGNKYKREMIYEAFRRTTLKISHSTTFAYVAYNTVKETRAKLEEQQRVSNEFSENLNDTLEIQTNEIKQEVDSLANLDVGKTIFDGWVADVEAKTGKPIDKTSEEYIKNKKQLLGE